MERRDRRERVDRVLDLVRDDDGPDEALTAVHDPVPDGVGVDELVDTGRFAVLDDVELEPGRSCVDGQRLHRPQPGSSGVRVSTEALRRPAPVAHVGHVVADLAGVRPVAEALLGHVLPHVRGARTKAGDAVDHVDH